VNKINANVKETMTQTGKEGESGSIDVDKDRVQGPETKEGSPRSMKDER
jgi:hypothetical protein